MTRVHFYELEGGLEAALRLCCRLAAKAMAGNLGSLSLLTQLDDEEDASRRIHTERSKMVILSSKSFRKWLKMTGHF